MNHRLSFCPNVWYWTDIDGILQSCSIQPEAVHEGGLSRSRSL